VDYSELILSKNRTEGLHNSTFPYLLIAFLLKMQLQLNSTIFKNPFYENTLLLTTAGYQFLPDNAWLTLYLSMCIVFVILGFNLFGDGLRDMFDS